MRSRCSEHGRAAADAELGRPQAGRGLARRRRRGAERRRGTGRRRDAGGGRQRGRRGCRDGLRAGGARAVEQRSRRHRLHGRDAAGRRARRNRRFRPDRPGGTRSGRLPPDRRDRDRAVHLAARRGRPQHARAALVRDPERGARLRRGGRALRADAVARSGRARRGAGAAGTAGRLVGDAEDRRGRRGSAPLRREPPGLAARRSAAGLAAQRRGAAADARPARRHAGAARRTGAGRFLQGRDRTGDRGRYPRRRRGAVGRGSRPVPGAHRAVARNPVSRLLAARGARADGGADPGRRARPAVEQALPAGARTRSISKR